jgi:hypothetical protein
VKLPPALLRHRVGLEPYLGSDATGPHYGPIQWRPAYVEVVRKSARSREGRVGTSATSVWLPLDRAIAPEWRVTVDGRQPEVLEVRQYDARIGTPDHTQILLQ